MLQPQITDQQHTTRSTPQPSPVSMQLVCMLQRRHPDQLAQVEVHAQLKHVLLRLLLLLTLARLAAAAAATVWLWQVAGVCHCCCHDGEP
jgi:hypothetical protein